MAKTKTVYICGECGFESMKWLGRCPACGSWNTIVEDQQIKIRPASSGGAVQHLADVSARHTARISTGMSELDRVTGGGLLSGMVALLCGDPGIGKSTLLMQAADSMAANSTVLYVSGEESSAQLKLRADRLKVTGDILLLCETSLERILDQAKATKCDILIVDSIQTLYSEESESSLGSVSQVRLCTAELTRYAKENGTAVLIVGHVTKEGAIAGPRVLEHIVDTVLYFEGDRHAGLRLLRAVKNRFGSTNEIGVFEMTDTGMQQVTDPSRLFLSGERYPGCAVTCTVEGSRPMLAEIQALLNPTSFGSPRRTASGLDAGRLSLLLAVLEQKAQIKLSDQDVYINVVGNLRLDERGVDLAVALCVASAFYRHPLPPDTACIGELGLTGELRSVAQLDTRLKECARLGYRRVIVPKSARPKAVDGITLISVSTVSEAIDTIRYCPD
ncbi:MAG: DNA repair protein RadA [Clostridia bacterium]|nr:DNA repair protein RadA [Clostridia bacterium]MBQ5758394.1 DNA repair protein RadA [Clostridia bacterium]